MICRHCQKDCIEMDKASASKLEKRDDVVAVCPQCWDSMTNIVIENIPTVVDEIESRLMADLKQPAIDDMLLLVGIIKLLLQERKGDLYD